MGIEPTSLLKLVCGATPCHPRQGRFATKDFNLHIYPSPDCIPTECGSKTIIQQWLQKLYKLLSVSYTINSILTDARSLVTGHGSPYIFGADWPARSITWRTGLLSLIFGWRIFVAILKLTHFAQGTSKVCPTSRLKHLAAVQFSFNGIRYLQQFRLIGLWI